MNNPPLLYNVTFHFLAKDKNNEISHHNWRKEFIDPDPYKAREEAFKEFYEYFKFLEDNERLGIDEYGNPKIITPSGITMEPKTFDHLKDQFDSQFFSIMKELFEYEEYEEKLDINLVINDYDLVNKIGYGDAVFTIHSVSSKPLPLQYLVDNLRIEFNLYDECNLQPHDHADIIQHFGEDYAESEEEEGAENYAILPSPMKWSTREIYDKKNNEEVGWEQKDPKSLWENIIQGGESNSLEFKPSLIYNYLPDTPNHIPRFNNAKTICGFLNARGGVLLIGISDDGVPQGIDGDLNFLGTRDKILLKIDQLIHSYFGDAVNPLIETSFEKAEDKEFIVIDVKPSNRPVFLKNYNPNTGLTTKHFFARRNASTSEIKDVEEIINYIFNHWLEE